MEIKRPESRQPMPANAEKVFSGILFDVYQWKQKQFDGSIEVFEKLRRTDTVMVIPVTTDKQIILLEQEQPGKKPFIGLAGGRADNYDELPEETAKRELLEETGYEAERFELFDAQQPLSKIDWAVYVLVGKNCRKVTEQKLDPGERISFKFVSFEEFIEIALSDRFADQELTTRIAFAKLDNNLAQLKSQILD